MERELPAPGPLDSKTVKASIVMLLSVAVSLGWIYISPEEIETLANGLIVLIPIAVVYFRLFKNQGQIDLSIFKK